MYPICGPRRRAFFLPETTAGYVLGELLVVVAILAAVAGVGWTVHAGIERDQADGLAVVQIDQLAQALRRFHADTGFWPGQGPFALAAAGNSETLVANGVDCSDFSGGLVLRSSLPPIELPAAPVGAQQWQQDWFGHPANLMQLLRAPAMCANHPLGRLQAWDNESQRGWRGPYLQPEKSLWVDAGNAGPDYEAAPLQRNLPAIPSGSAWVPLQPCNQASDWCAFRWRAVESLRSDYDAGRDQLRSAGRPVLYFGPDSGPVRLAHAGPDGRFGGFDAAYPCQANLAVAHGSDDLVRCLESN